MTLLAPPDASAPAPEPDVPSRATGGQQSWTDVLLPVAATASLGGAAIHFAVMPEHWDEYVLFGLFFGVLAWAQIAWSAAIYALRSRPTVFRWVLGLGALGQLAVVVLWVVTRTVGLPFGPEPGQPEAAGVIDEICCALEIVAAVAAVLVLTRFAHRPLRRAIAVALAAALVVASATAATASLVPSVGGGHEHAHAADGSELTAGHTHGAAATGDIPTGWVAGCHQHAANSGDLADVGHAAGSCTDAPVTAAQRAAAERLVADTTAGVVNRYPTLQAAEKAGYQVINQTGPLVHVGNPAFMNDGRVLDPQRVESLVYVNFGRASILLGAMYMAEPNAPQGPLIGGALTSWHIHTNLCVDPTRGTALNPKGDGSCAPGSAIGPTAQMLHVWTIPYQGGPFADISTPALITAVTSELQRRAAAAKAVQPS